VILDLGLPDRDGRELIAEVRVWSRVPILVCRAAARLGEGRAASISAAATTS
jgi:two-component system KDP operon response regulator KdpE